jgi:L-glutamine-phosphate cytidylyltransferase
MRVIILAAGRGSRMGSLTEQLPKGLVQLAGESLLERQLNVLRKANIEHIGIVRGYQADQIQMPGVTYFDNPEWSETNMLFSLCCAEAWLSADECIVAYSDIVYSPEAIDLLKGCRDDIAIPSNTNWLSLWEARFANPLDDAETFRLSKDGSLIEIGGAASCVEHIEGQFMGLLKFTPAGWSVVKDCLAALENGALRRMDMTGLLARLIVNGACIKVLPYDGLWLEVDSESDLSLYESEYHQMLT